MKWMTSVTSVCIFIQRNIATSTIELIFLIERIDARYPSHSALENCENIFGNVRRHKREALVQEFFDGTRIGA